MSLEGYSKPHVIEKKKPASGVVGVAVGAIRATVVGVEDLTRRPAEVLLTRPCTGSAAPNSCRSRQRRCSMASLINFSRAAHLAHATFVTTLGLRAQGAAAPPVLSVKAARQGAPNLPFPTCGTPTIMGPAILVMRHDLGRPARWCRSPP